MYTLGAGRILIESIIIVCLLNLMAWKASWAHRTGENEKKKENDKIKKSVQTSSACGLIWVCTVCPNISVRKLRVITVTHMSYTTKMNELQNFLYQSDLVLHRVLLYRPDCS